jgi:molecular chaperone GrpE
MKKDEPQVRKGVRDEGEAEDRDDVETAEASTEAEDARTDGEGPAPGEIDDLRRELEALNDRHLRLAAEFDNYRKRSQAELGTTGVRAQAALLEHLVEVLDDFGRVASLDPGTASVDAVLEGVNLVERKLHRVLEEAGLEALDPEGEAFDPTTMEAMARVPAETEEEDDTVAQVLQPGFRFRGHLVRPARVSVRKHD